MSRNAWGLALLAAVGWMDASLARDVTAVAEDAKRSIAAKDYARAVTIIDAAQKGDAAAQRDFDLNFLLGVAIQQRAQDTPDSESGHHVSPADVRRMQLTAAATVYERALEARPDSAAVLNNLAGVQAQLGNVDAARAAYEKAIELGKERRAFYALNYAKFLRSREPKAAVDYVTRAWKW